MQRKFFIILFVLLNLVLVGCNIEGTVTRNGEPLEGVTIELSGHVSITTTTGSDGKYIFLNVAEGDYTVTASFEDYRFYPESQKITKRNLWTVIGVDFEAVDVDFDRINAALSRSVDYLIAKQADEGYWMGSLKTDTSFTADYILLMHYLERVDEAKQQKAINHILEEQQPDGGWYAYPGGPSELYISVVDYLALKLAGVPADGPEMIMARDFILANGGAESVNRLVMIKLALFGQVPWAKMLQINTDFLLLEDLVYKMGYIHSVLIPYTVIYENYHRVQVPEERGVREIFIEDPWDGVMEQAPLKGCRQDWAIDWILERQEADGNWAGVFVNTMFCLLALKSTENLEEYEAVIDRGMAGVVEFQIETDGTIHQQFSQPPVMDTAYALHALLSTGMVSNDPVIEKGVDYLLSKQSLIIGDWYHNNPEGEPGGWGFEHYNLWFPDNDCTVMVLDAFAFLVDQGLWEVEEAVQRGTNWVVSMQNKDGGWAAWDKDPIYPCDLLIELMNEPWIPWETSYADITSRVILSLSNLGYPEQYNGNAEVICNAIEFIKREQKLLGYWYGRWGTNCTYGTGQVLQGLIAAGEDPCQPYIRRAVKWLKSVQNHDGGWGESPVSYLDQDYIGVGDSTAFQTAYVLIGLISAGEALSPEARKGIDYLVNTMRWDGSWYDAEFLGTNLPGYCYSRYELASTYKPVHALSLFLSQM